MLHLHPELVKMELAQDFVSLSVRDGTRRLLLTPEGTVGFGWQTQDLQTRAPPATPQPPMPILAATWLSAPRARSSACCRTSPTSRSPRSPRHGLRGMNERR